MTDDPFDPRLAERLAVFDDVVPPTPRPANDEGSGGGRRPAALAAAAVAIGIVLAVGFAVWPGDDDADIATGPTSTTATTTLVDGSTSTAPPPATTEPGADAVALAGTGTDVSIHDVTDQWPRETPRDEIPARVGDLTTWNANVVSLPDGRAVVRGIWDQDEPVETWFRFRNFSDDPPEPTYRTDRPIRLFLVDWTSGDVTPLSPLTDFHTTQTATTESYFYEIPLEFELLDDGTTIRFTTGFNGAAYDIPYTLWEVEVPARP